MGPAVGGPAAGRRRYTQHHIRCPHSALLRAESKANRKYGTGRCLALFRYPGFGCTGAVVKRVIQTVSLLSDWAGDSHPALKYIETRWASMISYEMTTRLLKDILPVGYSLDASR